MKRALAASLLLGACAGGGGQAVNRAGPAGTEASGSCLTAASCLPAGARAWRYRQVVYPARSDLHRP